MHSEASSALAHADSLDRDVAALTRRLENLAASAGWRKWLTAALLGALVAGAAAYLTWLHGTIREFAEPNTLVELASATIQPRLEEEVGRVQERLVAEAPAVLDQAEKLVLEAPPKIVAGAGDYLASQFDGHLSTLEEKVYTLVSGMLKESLDRARASGIDLEDDAQVDLLVDKAAPLMRAELKKAVDEIYSEYLASAEGIGAMVDRLTGGESLDQAELRQKEILVTGLAIIRKLEADPSRSPVQGVIRGDSPRAP